MVYAFGYVLYELFTHGCQPFTEMSCRTTDDILQLVSRPIFFLTLVESVAIGVIAFSGEIVTY